MTDREAEIAEIKRVANAILPSITNAVITLDTLTQKYNVIKNETIAKLHNADSYGIAYVKCLEDIVAEVE